MLHAIRGVLAVEGEQTGDGRILAEGCLTWADLPLPFACLTGDQHAHGESEQVGTIDTITRAGNLVGFTGFVDDQIEQGAEMVRQMQAGSAPLGNRFGVSVDPDDWEVELVDTNPIDDIMVLMMASGHGRLPAGSLSSLIAAAGEGDPGGVVVMEDSADALIERYTRLRIRGATACSVAAFDGAYVELTTADQTTVTEPAPGSVTVTVQQASGTAATMVAIPEGVTAPAPTITISEATDGNDPNTAAPLEVSVIVAAGGPARPPGSWFADPKFAVGDGRMIRQPSGAFACPHTVTPDGRVFGHMASWFGPHTSFADRPVMPPRSQTGYAAFLRTPVETEEGDLVRVGLVSMGCGHHTAPRWTVQEVNDHYDGGPGAVRCAWVNVGEDEFGPWYAGALLPGLSEEQVHGFAACGVSGDWREVWRGKGLDLVALLAGVTVPGFPIAALAAAGLAPMELPADMRLPQGPISRFEDGRPTVLLAAGMIRALMPWERATADLASRLDVMEGRLISAERVTQALRSEAAGHILEAAGLPAEVLVAD